MFHSLRSSLEEACLEGTLSDGLPHGDHLEPRVSSSNQEMLMSVSEGFFWYVRCALKARGGTMRYQKTHATGRKFKGLMNTTAANDSHTLSLFN
jgi:hypothetical protein